MTILDMITEWRKGCGNSLDKSGDLGVRHTPYLCRTCTEGLIDAIEGRMQRSRLLQDADNAQNWLERRIDPLG